MGASSNARAELRRKRQFNRVEEVKHLLEQPETRAVAQAYVIFGGDLQRRMEESLKAPGVDNRKRRAIVRAQKLAAQRKEHRQKMAVEHQNALNRMGMKIRRSLERKEARQGRQHQGAR